jgi:dipeptide/tripeptide permease
MTRFIGILVEKAKKFPMGLATFPTKVTAATKNYLKDFATLKGSPKEMWIAFFLKFLESFAYFTMFMTIVSFLSEDFGYSDLQAGWIYGTVGLLISVYGILLGFVVDNLGVRKSLILGTILTVAGRAMVAFTKDPMVLNVALYVVLPIGVAFGIPVLVTGLRRYTNDKSRTFAFSMFYAMMNVGALVGFPFIDWARFHLKNGIDVNLWGLIPSVHLTKFQFLYSTTVFASVVMLGIALFFVREIDAESGKVEAFRPRKGTPWKIYCEVMKTSQFWRFLLFIGLLVGVRFVFRHLDATFPKYFVRELGEGALYGTVTSINPLMIIFLAPLLTPFVKKMKLFNAIFFGSMISALSVFFLTIEAAYWTAIAFVVMLSIGEAIWSPRLYEYTTIIAPKGREGTYTALSSAPMFLAKFAIGGLSGWLLTQYCPETLPEGGVRNSEFMWLIIGLITISSPILILLLKKVITGSEEKKGKVVGE